MRTIKVLLVCLLLGVALQPAVIRANPYNDGWQGIVAENIYPWGQRLWEPWERAVPKKPYRIGISIPSLGSPYFVNAVYGFLTEAEATGVGVTILAAKGYDDLQ